MNKENINRIGSWVAVVLCVCFAAYFAAKGNNDAAGGFGIGAGAILFFSFLSSLV